MNLKKIGKVFTSKFVGTGPSSYKKKEFTGPRSHEVEKHWYKGQRLPVTTLINLIHETKP